MSSKFEEQDKSNQQTECDVNLMDFHLCLSPYEYGFMVLPMFADGMVPFIDRGLLKPTWCVTHLRLSTSVKAKWLPNAKRLKWQGLIRCWHHDFPELSEF